MTPSPLKRRPWLRFKKFKLKFMKFKLKFKKFKL